MELDFSQVFETIHVRSTSDLSYFSSRVSIQDMNPDEFYDLCKARLKVSKHNTALMLKIK